ncbi:MAG: molybdopterin oxidoreductase, partial [Deltaproteobacteria bacterium]|nr:molybdopterin oxidoreductase [Deltaproteobacteria bacterium]
MDSALIPKGVKRCPTWQFALWIGGISVLVLWGVYAMLLCWMKGLNQTNMNDSYGFALWIWADLTVIAIGGGAFFSGFLRYIVGKDVLKSIINYAVVIGFVCYGAAQLILGIDV